MEDVIIKQVASTAPYTFLMELATRGSYTQSERGLLRFFAERVAKDCRFELDLEEAKRVTGASQRSVEELSRAYRTGGYAAAVRRIIEVEKQELLWRYIDPAELAYEYAALGDKGETFRWLEKAYRERSRSLQSIRIEPSMDALRTDVRYIDLLHRMGLEN
jgi:hypothetical protein